ncbi:GAF domain-containing protein [Dietzia sp. ANT_WB102]|uniref:helix-turn-helix domain-containing protein n=1 Tax=Dietzia sp. ANT_WB102 TaxID=2597345 RepID=UPI0011EDD44B|nr:GAF domain-containing protein [Dietzia sp. ANT_WB102]KAA0918862.1 GAF domain-containing protein [Dietzia sp. ANT_WB102]
MVIAHDADDGSDTSGSLSGLLRSIADRDSEADFDAHLRRAEAGLDAAEAARVRAAAHAARGALMTEHLRASRMREVHESTGELVAIHNVDAVLREITSRARRLLECEYVYLNTPDESGEGSFAIRAWSGDLDPEFLGVTVAPGVGVGGIVLQTGETFQVSDYGSTHRIARSPGYTDLLARQGISTLLGTPLMVSGRITGLLFAARSHASAFTDDEVFLLTALAQHAAIALQNAESDERRERALRELSVAIEQSETKRAEQERQSRLQARLSSIILDGAGVAEVLDAVRGEAGIDIAYVDTSRGPGGHVIGAVPGMPDPGVLAATRGEISRPGVRAVSVRGRRWSVIDVVAYNRVLGHLVSGPRGLDDEAAARLLEWTSQATALCQLSTQALADAERRSAREVVRRLVSSASPTHELRRQVHRSGIGTDGLRVLLLDTGGEPTEGVFTDLTVRHGGLAAELEDAVVVLTPAGDDASVLELAEEMRRRLPVNVVVGRHIRDLARISSEYSQALRAARLAAALGYSGEVLRVEQFGVFSMLFTDPDAVDLEMFVRVQVGPLLDADARHGTELASTALTVLDHAGGLTSAAKALNVHPNTVAQRVGRITRLLGPGWREQPRAFEIHAALKLDGLRAAAR